MLIYFPNDKSEGIQKLKRYLKNQIISIRQ